MIYKLIATTATGRKLECICGTLESAQQGAGFWVEEFGFTCEIIEIPTRY